METVDGNAVTCYTLNSQNHPKYLSSYASLMFNRNNVGRRSLKNSTFTL